MTKGYRIVDADTPGWGSRVCSNEILTRFRWSSLRRLILSDLALYLLNGLAAELEDADEDDGWASLLDAAAGIAGLLAAESAISK